ncbi:MAG: protein kinase [Acidobacteria bacterium]|nr:protein kinase [Acidobacteriota bacterium]
MTLPPGTRLGNYEIVRVLGRGGMGEVYLARDERLDREIALKFVMPEKAADPDTRKRFLREARLASRLLHPSAAVIYEVGEWQDQLFLAMEFVPGETLSKRLKSGPFPVAEVLPIARQLAAVLAAAHSQGIVHRDVKPGNIILTDTGQVKLLDFGLATLNSFGSGEGDHPTETMLTTPGAVAGTPAYLSPERINGQSGDARGDLFAVGIVLYELVTGRHPFTGPTPLVTLANILSHQPEPITRVGLVVPPALGRAIFRCLAKKAEDRYASADELLADLEILAPTHSRRGLALAVGGGAVGLGVLGGGVYLWRRTRNQSRFDSLAVLPFTIADSAQTFLADGVTDALIANVGKVNSLRVLARSAVYNPKVPRQDPIASGLMLKVATVLTGRMETTPTGYSVRVELIEAATSRFLWGRTFVVARELIASLQSDISLALLAYLGVEPEQGPAERSAAVPAASYQAYMMGRFQLNKRSKEGIEKSLGYFEEALRLHPDYALPYVGLAAAFNSQSGMIRPSEVFPKALTALDKALQLDPLLAEAHSVKGWTRMTFHWDWPGAEAGLQRAIQLNPSYAVAHSNYATLLTCRKRFSEATAQNELAAKLDPVSAGINVLRGYFYYLSRQNDRALSHLTGVLKAEKSSAQALFFRGTALIQAGRYSDAIRDFEAGLEVVPTDSGTLADLGLAYARAGQPAQARAQLDKIAEIATKRYVSPYFQALPHLGLGDLQKALDLLEQAAEDRSFPVIYIGVEPKLDPLRKEPRFLRLLTLVGLA